MKEKLEIIVSNFSFQVQYATQPITVQTKTQYVNSHGSLTANCLMNVPMNRIQMESKYTPLFDISKEDIIYMDRGQKSSRNNDQQSSFINYSLLKDWGSKAKSKKQKLPFLYVMVLKKDQNIIQRQYRLHSVRSITITGKYF